MYKNQNGVIKKLKVKQKINHECIKSLMATIYIMGKKCIAFFNGMI